MNTVPDCQVKTGTLCTLLFLLFIPLSACTAASSQPMLPFQVESDAGTRLQAQPLAAFEQPWAMTFLPSGQLLVSEKVGTLWLLDLPQPLNAKDVQVVSEQQVANSPAGTSAEVEALAQKDSEMSIVKTQVAGLPPIQAAGQGGLGDVIIHPQFADNQLVYFSYVERDGDLSGAVVARAVLDQSDSQSPVLTNQEVIWRQFPKVTGQGHYGYRLAFSPDGYLYISSGDRQKFDPAQDMQQNLGKVIRLNDDGSVPVDNPFAEMDGVAPQIWSLGHRNPLGMAFDNQGKLWVHEMGPRGGDELNLISAGSNYGYPLVSNGNHYSGVPIPDHSTRPDLSAPALSWSPVISPAGLVIYDGNLIEGWQGSALIGGLSSQSLVRVRLDVPASEVERFAMGERIREVEQNAQGQLFLLEDKSGGRLLQISEQ